MYNISGIGNIKENLWFTSDTRFYDYTALEKLSRPFDSVEEMNHVMVERWNELIKPRDIVYHLGNFSTGSRGQTKEILDNLNGRFNLIVGSEDSNSNILGLRNKLASSNYRLEITVNRYLLTLNHYPQRRWNEDHKANSYMLHGFCGHSMPPEFGKLTLDVGVDGFNFYPVHFDEILEIMEEKKNYHEKVNRALTYGIII